MLHLHTATHRFLADGREGFTRKLDDDRLALRAEVISLMPEDFCVEIRHHFDRTPAPAFAYREAAFIAAQVNAVRRFSEEENSGNSNAFSVRWLDHPDKGYSELILATRDRPLHLEKLCCALASEQINILSADLFTRTDGIVLNIFRVCTTNFEPVSDDSTRMRFLATFTTILSAGQYDSETYLKRKVNFLKPRTETGLSVPVRAQVSNDLHPTCTTVEIQALDRIGLLHDLFHTVNEAGLDTTHARICTEKGVAMDTLYITIPGGGKVTGEAELRALEKKFNSLVARTET